MQRLSHPWLDDSEYPILRVTYPQQYAYEQNVLMFQDVERFYARNRAPFAWIVDVRQVRTADAKGRKLTAEHEERSKEHQRAFNSGTAFVIQSAWVRGIVTAIFWLSPPGYPYEVFSELEAAREWAKRQLQARLASDTRARTG